MNVNILREKQKGQKEVGLCCTRDCVSSDKKKSWFYSQVSVFVAIKIGQDNGLYPTWSDQRCTEQEDLRNIFLSNIAVNYTIANL